MNDNSPFRILCIDGGGVRGIFPAHFLALLENTLEAPLSTIFDLLVGTSTGAIIAAGLATGQHAATIADMYTYRSAHIFARQKLSIRGLLRSKYRPEPLRQVLTDIFGERTMALVPAKLILPATDVSNGNVFVIKSAYDNEFVRDGDIRLVDAVMASCAAPGYFDPVRVKEYLLADGGLWSNNPSLLAHVEAVSRLRVPTDDIRILSVGTGTGQQFYDIGHLRHDWGLLRGWRALQLIELIFNLQTRAASNAAQLLLSEQYKRVSFQGSGSLPLDDVRKIPELKARAAQAFTYEWDSVRNFLQLSSLKPVEHGDHTSTTSPIPTSAGTR
jgi:uncharacterized protein